MKSVFLVLVLGLTLSSCIPLPTEQGVCKTSDGDVNTHNIVGIWKKVPKTPAEKAEFSADTFRLLYITRGNAQGTVLEGDVIEGIEIDYAHAICMVRVNGNEQVKPIEGGLYYQDTPRNRIRVNKIVGLDGRSGSEDRVEEWQTYSFSGNCNSTRLTLTQGANVDEYTFFGSAPPNSQCDFGLELEE